MKKHLLHTFVAMCLLTFSLAGSHAQERTAGGNLQTESSWSALQALINKTQGDVNLTKIDINAIKNCAAQGKLYAGSGCRDAVIPADPRISQIANCGSLGKLYSANANACIDAAGGNRWVYSRVGPTATSDAYSPGAAWPQVRSALSSMGIGECASTTQGLKCSSAGAQCAYLTSTSSGGGGNKYGPDTTVTSYILMCN